MNPKDKCKKCKKEYNQWRSIYVVGHELCSDCGDKRKRNELIVGIALVVLFLSAVVGVRMLWAEIVYKDSRCAFAECRINVDPN